MHCIRPGSGAEKDFPTAGFVKNNLGTTLLITPLQPPGEHLQQVFAKEPSADRHAGSVSRPFVKCPRQGMSSPARRAVGSSNLQDTEVMTPESACSHAGVDRVTAWPAQPAIFVFWGQTESTCTPRALPLHQQGQYIRTKRVEKSSPKANFYESPPYQPGQAHAHALPPADRHTLGVSWSLVKMAAPDLQRIGKARGRFE